LASRLELSTIPFKLKEPESASEKSIAAWAWLTLSLILIATSWWIFGTRFYDRVLPFYDSASYQEGYRAVAAAANANGTIPTVVAVWKEPASNVVLYRFFAAVVGSWLPYPRTGLFVYLFGLHLLAGIVLFTTVRTITDRFLPAFAAVSVWFLTTPFGLLRDGVGDQRMDLSSGSAFLIVSALGLRWTFAPTLTGAFLTGFAAALAALHRPILIPAIAILGVLLAVTALCQHRKTAGQWLLGAVSALLPIGLIAAPWFLRHYDEIRVYYLEYGPDLGTSVTLQTAAWFHWLHFQSAFGLPAVLALVGGLLLSARQMRVHPGRAILIALVVACPLAVLIGFKSSGNVYVQQASLGVPALFLAAWRSDKSSNGWASNWDARIGCFFLLTAVVVSPLRLNHALGREQGHERQEVTQMLHQIPIDETVTHIAGFHDLPVSPISLCMVARDLGIPLQLGIVAYYPSDFGLSNDHLTDYDSNSVHHAVAAKLAVIKQHDYSIILPSADTLFRLWDGLYSHRLIPVIRKQIEQDSDFLDPIRIGPVNHVYFDFYRNRRI